MKRFFKKILIAIMLASIFTTYVPAISSIVWAIEEINEEEQQESEVNNEQQNLNEESNSETNINQQEIKEDTKIKNNEVIQDNPVDSVNNNNGTNKEQDEMSDGNDKQDEYSTKIKSLNNVKSTPNEIVELDEIIKNALINDGYEPGDDNQFSKEELSNEYITYLNLDCSNENIDLSGIEYITNLESISIYNVYGTINVYNLSNLVKLKTLNISGNITSIENLEYLTNLTSLSCYFNGNFVNIKPDISNQIENLTDLTSLSIEGSYTLDFSELTKLTKLEYLSLGGSYTDDLLNCEVIGNLSNLKSLQIRYYKLDNLKGLEKLSKLNTLNLALRYNEGVDTETITKITSLEKLYLEGIDLSNIEWLKNITGLKLLNLSNYNNSNNFTEEFFNYLNTLDVEKIELYGSTTFNIGIVEVDKENEFDLQNVPWIKEILNPNSKLYLNKDELNFYFSDYYDNENNVRIDNDNLKMYFIPKDDTKRYSSIYGNGGINIKVEWQTASDSEVPELSEKLRQALINNSYDTNNDGILNMSELNTEQHTFLSIYFNSNEKFDLTGIEYVKNLTDLSISAYDTIDLTEVSKLKNLRSLTLSGKCDTSTLYLVPQIYRLTLSMYSSETSANLDDLKALKNLNSLSIYGLKESSISALNDLTNLGELSIRFNNKTKVNVNEINNLNNLYTLTLYNIDASDLSGLENLKSLIDLKIEQATGYYDKIDKATLQKLNNLETLGLIATNDLNWINNIENLYLVTLSGGNDYEGIELTQDYLDSLKNISARIKFNGSFNYNIGNIEVGKELNKNIYEIPIFKELTDTNSKFYANNININCYSYGENSNYTYDSENKILNVKANDISSNSASLNVNYSSANNVYGYLNLRVKWKGYINGDKSKIISIKDDNLKKELLEKYDIDDDKQITEHDMINIYELNLANKNISDITGIENATNMEWFNLSNNQISDLTPLISIMKNNDCWGQVDNNYIESLEGLESLNFSNIDLSNNYIDFSENSNNLHIVEEYITKYVDEDFENNPEIAENTSKEQYINNMKSRILGCYKIQKYGTVVERNDTLEFEQSLFNTLKENGFDTNSDGKITKGELSDSFADTHNTYYETLDLSNIGISNIENLKYLANVRVIDLSGNNITDISPLSQVKDLHKINLGNNKIENIESVKDFFNVSTLNLSNNKIKDISPLQYLRHAKVVYMGEGTGLFAGGMEPYRELNINLANNEIEDVSTLNELATLSTANLSGNKISDISALSNYDFNALYEGFEDDEYFEYYDHSGVKIDVTKNYIDACDNKNIEAINHFENNNSKIEIGDQYIKLIDEKSNITIETYGETTAKIQVDEIEKDTEKPEEVSQKIGDMEVLYAANISIVDGEYNGKITVTIPLDKKLNGLQVKVVHQKENGTVEEFNKKVKDASVTVEVDELSPFYVAYDKEQYKQGDVNGDGKVNAGDYVAVLNYVRKKIVLTEEQLQRADANGDGKVNAGDYVTILNIVRGKI